MRSKVLLILTVISLISCNQNYKYKSIQSRSTSEILEMAEQITDSLIVVHGTVTSICPRTGKRLFIKGDEHQQSIRIETTENPFKGDPTGKKIIVTGILKANKLTADKIAIWKQKVTQRMGTTDKTKNNARIEATNIEKMEQWMAKYNTDFYAIYYIIATNYQIVE